MNDAWKKDENTERGIIEDANNIYYYDYKSNPVTERLITKIYDKNFNLIYAAKGDYIDSYVVSSNGELVISDQNKFYVFDNYKVKYESKVYDKIYSNVEDYVIVNNNGYLALVNNQGKEVTRFVKITDDIKIHGLISGWYTENGKNGIYVVVGDKRVTLEDFPEEERENHKGVDFGY